MTDSIRRVFESGCGLEQSQRAAHPVHEVEERLREDAEEDRRSRGEDGHERHLGLSTQARRGGLLAGCA